MTRDEYTPEFITRWFETLTDISFDEIAPDPNRSAVFSADMINGFLREGALATPRVNELTEPVVAIVQRAREHGIRAFVFLQDTHTEDNPEFQSYPPHAVSGTIESEMIPELANLPFADTFTVIPKNSLNPALDTEFDDWLEGHPELRTAIVVGNCTDLCTYQLAMHLRMRANARGLQDFAVIVPEATTQTFSIPEYAGQPAGTAHPGDFFHQVFLYHMASNGIRVVRSIR
jgi:nicotinamidase-related amidase